MTLDKKTTKAVDKIRKLLARARDAAASEAETETCMIRARELMDEYGVDPEAAEERREGPGRENGTMKYFDPWRRTLFTQCARYYGCEMISMNAGGQRGDYALVGRPSSRAVALDMYGYLEATTVRLAREYRKSTGGPRAEQLDFERGCGVRLANRLQELRKQNEAAAQVVGQGTALVLVTEIRETRDWMSSHMSTRAATNKTSFRGEGAAAGQAAADKVHLGGQIGRSGGPIRLGRG